MKLVRPRGWRTVLLQAVCGGIGSIAALSVARFPSNAAEAAWVGLAGLIGGLAVAFAVEYAVLLHQEARRLAAIERTLADERAQRAEERKLWEYQLTLAKRELAVSEVAVEVFGGAFNEAVRGQVLPLSAIMARMENLQKARGIDTPMPPYRPLQSDRAV